MQTPNLTIPDIIDDLTKDFTNIFSTHDENDEPEIEIKPSGYFSESDFNDLIKTKKISEKTHATIFSLNIANVLSKLSSLKLMINNTSNESYHPCLIALTETHLHESQNHGYSQSELQDILPGYKFHFKNRKTKKGGGVGIFVTNKLTAFR